MSVRPPISPHVSEQLPLEMIFVKVDIRDFYENLSSNTRLG